MASIMVHQGLLYRGPWVKISYIRIYSVRHSTGGKNTVKFPYFISKFNFYMCYLIPISNVHYILCFSFQEKAQVDTLHFWDGERKIDIILGTIHILRQQKDWKAGLKKQQFFADTQ